jgi:hypothetical protein
LAALDLTANSIARLATQDDVGFPALEKLLLTENLVDDWESIDTLNLLPNLRDLRILYNPITKSPLPLLTDYCCRRCGS